MARSKSMTLAEHNAMLATNPAYVKMRQEKDAALEERSKQLREDALPLLEELREAGWNVNSPWDLVNTSTPYTDAIPILLKHLTRPYMDRNREAIARALAVPGASYAWPALKQEYSHAPSNTGVKSGLAVALSVIAKEDNIEDLVDLIKDPKNGESRILLLQGLKKYRRSAARDALAGMSTDSVLAKEMAAWGRV